MVNLRTLSLVFGLFHGIYISVVELVISEDRIHAVVKVFEDDFRNALMFFDSASYAGMNDYSLSQAYLNENLVIHADNEPVRMVIDSIVVAGDSYRIYLNAPLSNPIRSGGISSGQLRELFPTQQNIVKLEFEGRKTYHIFRQGNWDEPFAF